MMIGIKDKGVIKMDKIEKYLDEKKLQTSGGAEPREIRDMLMAKIGNILAQEVSYDNISNKEYKDIKTAIKKILKV